MLLDLLFPKTCLSCNKLGRYICPLCWRKLSYFDRDTCLVCRKLSFLGFTHTECRKSTNIDGVLSVFHYNTTLKKILKNIKYRLVTDAWKELFDGINPHMYYKFSQFGILPLQPIPLHKRKYTLRGFNQAHTIALFFEKMTQATISQALIRIEYRDPQAQLTDSEARIRNASGIFQVAPVAVPERIVLVDDVVTTGATVNEAARVLRESGVNKVYVFCLARG